MHIDIQVLQTLRDLGEDDDEFLRSLVLTFIELSQGVIVDMTNAVVQKNCRALDYAAHRLKGSSYNLGARSMGILCQKLESQARHDNLEGTTDILRELENVFACTSQELVAYISS